MSCFLMIGVVNHWGGVLHPLGNLRAVDPLPRKMHVKFCTVSGGYRFL